MKQYVAIISNSIIRDAQVFSGTPDDLDTLEYDETQELWLDDNQHSFFLGIYSGDDEHKLREFIAAKEEINPAFVELIPIDNKED